MVLVRFPSSRRSVGQVVLRTMLGGSATFLAADYTEAVTEQVQPERRLRRSP